MSQHGRVAGGGDATVPRRRSSRDPDAARAAADPQGQDSRAQALQPDSQPADGDGDLICRLIDVHKSFGSLHVLRGVSLDFPRGKTTVVLGPSGTGKSVLIKHIVGLLRPDRGEVWLEDQRIDQMKEHDLVEVRKKVGYLFQMGALFDSKTVAENICFPLLEHARISRGEREKRCARALAMVGLSGFEKKMPADLSGGQRKRVALARAIVLEPDLILYDEPTTGLDPITADTINELILSLAQRVGVTGIAVTHDMTSARKIADRMVLLYDGQVVADAPKAEFLESDNELVRRFIEGRAEEEDVQRIHEGFEQIDSAAAAAQGAS